MEFNKEKFKNLVHYICRSKATEPEKLGKTKLHKILWYSEGRSFLLRGEILTGGSYIKKQYGPFSPNLDEILNELKTEGLLTIHPVDFYGKEQIQLIGKGAPDTSLFTDKQLRTIDNVVEQICEDHTAQSISDKSHGEIWRIAADGEPLPFEAVLVENLAPISDEDIEWAKAELANQ